MIVGKEDGGKEGRKRRGGVEEGKRRGRGGEEEGRRRRGRKRRVRGKGEWEEGSSPCYLRMLVLYIPVYINKEIYYLSLHMLLSFCRDLACTCPPLYFTKQNKTIFDIYVSCLWIKLRRYAGRYEQKS